MKKLVCIIAAAMGICAAASAQKTSDLGAWLNLQATASIGKGGYALLRGEYRANNDLKNTECMFMVLAGGYRFAPWLSADLGYEMWSIGSNLNQKAVLTATGTLRRENLAFSLREKYELTFTPSGSTNNCLRSRIRGQYYSEGAFRPYLAAELFAWSGWQRALFYIGTEISLSKHSTIDIFYCYHMPNGTMPVSTLGLGYYFNFSL